MFPDPDILWLDYPSPIDGIAGNMFAYDLGYRKGKVAIAVSPPSNVSHGKHFRIEIACHAYFGVEELFYSIADHGDRRGRYDGGVYVKKAARSRLLDFWRANDPVGRPALHFQFVGADFCYETLGLSEPVVHEFDDMRDAYDWPRPELL